MQDEARVDIRCTIGWRAEVVCGAEEASLGARDGEGGDGGDGGGGGDRAGGDGGDSIGVGNEGAADGY